MAKYSLQKGDKIKARTPAAISENPPHKNVGGHETYEGELTVTKVFDHGVRTKERGYVHNNNIIRKLSVTA